MGFCIKRKLLRLWVVTALCCNLFVSISFGANDQETLREVFNADYYYNQNPDLQATIGYHPDLLFQHFISVGIREGRPGNEEFNLKAYVFSNPDLLAGYKTDLAAYCRHYLTTGKAEGRMHWMPEEKQTLVGFYTTVYNTEIPRAVNVELAADRINGRVLQPGERFSFSQAVLSRTKQNGYVLAPAIGGYEYGGGICQVSSTLYAAMCHALLPATERHPHSARVSYLPAGLDATISEGRKDLQFINIYPEPLMIHAVTEGGNLTVSLYLGQDEEPVPEQGQEQEQDQTQEQSQEQDQTQGQTQEQGQSEGQTQEQGQALESSPAEVGPGAFLSAKQES